MYVVSEGMVMKKTLFAVIVLFFAIAKPILAAFDRFDVPNDCRSIQAAIDDPSCDDGDLIVVQATTFDNPSHPLYDLSGFYNVDFKGKAIMVFGAGTAAGTKIVIPPGSNSRGFYFHSGEDSNSILIGFTIEGGDVMSNPNPYGGGIWCDSNSSPTIRNVIIKNSSAIYGGGIACTGSSSPLITQYPGAGITSITNNDAVYGGGIYCENSSPTITDCDISGNFAYSNLSDPNAYGGGIYCISSSPTIENCQVNNNIVSSEAYSGLSYGGGIYCKNSSPNITKCQVNDNTAGGPDILNDYYQGYGGGIYCWNSSPEIAECNIIGNIADGEWVSYAESYGGGIGCEYFSSPTIQNSIIADNESVHGGGISCYDSSSPTIASCTISGNWAFDGEGGGVLLESDCNSIISSCTIKGNWGDYAGGGINIYSSSPVISSCVIVGNTGWFSGGGIDCTDSLPTVMNSTIAGNAAAAAGATGGGAYIEGSSPVFTNSILWGNTDYDSAGTVESAQIHVFSGTPDVNYSCIEGLSVFSGNNNIDSNPLFVIDPNDGGDGWGFDFVFGPYEEANDNFGDLHIRSNSPYRETGDPGFSAGPNDIDIDGELRVVGGRVDIGADEFYNNYEGDFDFDEAVDVNDLGIFTSHWQDTGCDDSAGDYTDWCYGTDLNHSGNVEFIDYARFAINWLTTFEP